MDNNNTFDWLAVQAQSSDKTFADLYSVGVDPNNTTLQSKDFYMKTPKVQQMFKTPTGEFDQDKFDKFYSSAEQSYNQYKKSDFDLGNVTTDLWDDTSVARALKAPIRKDPVKISLTSNDPFTNLKVAQGSFLGLTEINKWSKPTKTVAEVAQGQKIIDSTTGKDMDITPEDNGLGNLFGFFSEPLVLAQYDKDEKDDKGRVIHKKGELKYDDKGLPRYETLAGRNLSGRQQLSRWDTLTKEDSYLNKWDFMDSDDIDKSTTGTIVKAGVELLPFLLGGGVSNAYKAYYIATNLLDGAAEVGKAIDGITNNDKSGNFYKFANQLQGYIGQAKGGMSEYGRDNFFSLENIASQAVDSVYQLMSQRAIAQWPSKLKEYQIAKELNLSPKGMFDVGKDVENSILELEPYLNKFGGDEQKAILALSKNSDQLAKIAKYSQYFSTAYMAATSAVGISQAADEAGLDSRDKGVLYLGYTAALVPLFRTEVGQWVEHGLAIDHMAKDMNNSIKDYANKYLPAIAKQVEETVGDNTTKGRGIQMMAVGKRIGQFIADKYKNFDVHSALTAGIAEATEEFTEQGLQDALQGIYNGLASHGIKSTQDQAQFDMNTQDVLKDLGANAFGGLLGGVIFHKVESHMDPDAHNTLKNRTMMEYVTEGHASKLIDKINTMKTNGELGDTRLSIAPLTDTNNQPINGLWKPVNNENQTSQNDFIADRMTKGIQVIDALRKMYGINSPNATAEHKNTFYQALVDTKTDTDLPDRIRDVAQRIYSNSLDLSQLAGSEDENSADAITKKKIELNALKKELEYLQTDQSLDEFFRQGLFNIRKDVNSAFGVKTKEDFMKTVNPNAKKFSELTGSERDKVMELYNNYKLDDNGLKKDLYQARLDYERFNTNMERKGHYANLEVFKQSLEQLKLYANEGEFLLNDKDENKIGSYNSYELMNDYVNKLSLVKYIPDYVYDDIKQKLSTFASRKSESYLSLISGEVDALKEDTYKNLNTLDLSLNDPSIKSYLEKRFGASTFNDFVNSPEFNDLKTNKEGAADYSLLSVLKNIGRAKEDPKLLESKPAKDILNNLTEDDAQNIMMTGRIAPELTGLAEYFDKHKFGEFMQHMDNNAGLDAYSILDSIGGKEFLRNFIRLNELNALEKDGQFTPDATLLSIDSRLSKDMMLNLLLDGEHTGDRNVVDLNTIQHLNTTELELAVDHAKNFDKVRVASPLRDALKDEYDFVESQFKTLDTIGYDNYSNSDQAFMDSFDGITNAIKRVGALLESAVSMNPLINDFRKNYGSTLDTATKDIRLFEIGNIDATHLIDELNRLNYKVQFLKDLNEHNVNNTLERLLKEDGIELASKYNTLKDIASDPEVLARIPSLGQLFQLGNIIEYTTDVKRASNNLKRVALHDMVKFEDAINNDFKILADDDKKLVINKTFKPISVYNREFYAAPDADTSYNDSLRTIYLAKVYGASATDFYTRYAGNFDDADQLYENIDKMSHTPFPAQENAVRLTHLLMHGDRLVVENLRNAYTKTTNEAGYNFNVGSVKSIESDSSITIWGAAGTGKTTAVLTNTINQSDPADGNVLLLAPKNRQVEKLVQTLTDSGFENRIDKENSRVVRDFLKGLGLTEIRSKKAYNFDDNDALVNAIDSEDPQGIRDEFNNKVKSIMDNMDIYKAKGDNNYTLRDDIANAIGKYRILAIDEYTWINPYDIAILNKLIDIYNGSTAVQANPNQRVTLVNMGDPTQSGYTDGSGRRRDITSLTNLIISQPLATPLRSGIDLINNTSIDIATRTVNLNFMSDEQLSSTETLQYAKENPLVLNYYEGKDGNKGIKSVKTQGDTSSGDISFITDNKHLLSGKEIVYVVNDESQVPKAEAILKDTLGDNWRNFVDIYTPSEIQGGEYRYAIVDAKPTMNDTIYDIRRVHEFLNTMLTRATEATLLVESPEVDKFVTLQNTKKDKTITQIKITKKVRDDVKAEKQKLLRMILEGPSSQVEDAEQAPSTDQPVSEDTDVPTEAKPIPKATPTAPTPKPSDEGKKQQPLIVTTIDKVLPVFQTPVYEQEITDEGKSLASNVMSYNSFSTAEDYDKVFKMMFPDKLSQELPNFEDKISSLINSYKYYLLHREQLGDQNITLRNNFINEFQDEYHNDIYEWENPKFYVEITQRGERNKMVGRNQVGSTYNERPDEVISVLKVKLPHVDDDEKSLVLTMGVLNSVDSITDKVVHPQDVRGQKVVDFFKAAKQYVLNNKTAPKFGESVNEGNGNVWRSKEFNARDLEGMSQIFGSRLMPVDGKSKLSYEDLSRMYSDFTITQPQVVVANLIDSNNESVLDASGKNSDYKRIWEDLKGKSVVFVSDVYELHNETPDKLLQIYMKQLDHFHYGTDDNGLPFKKLSKDGKDRYIRNIAVNQNDVITTVTGQKIWYKPNMVQMIKVDNPTSTFMEFRERFLQAIAKHEVGTKLTVEQLEQFNTSIYVKDRLIKSLMVVDQFLKDSEDNRQWFIKNVLVDQNTNAQERIDKFYSDLRNEMGEQFANNAVLNKYTLETSGALRLDEFMSKLSGLFDPESGIIRGKFATDGDTNRKADRTSTEAITKDDMIIKLTNNKQKDFAGSLIDIRMFNLLKQTKNVNFAELIDLALRKFSGLSGKYSKYNLGGVFKDGKIEGIVLATKKENVSYISNVLTDAIAHPGGFQVGVRPTHPSYSIDFATFIENQSGEKIQSPQEKAQTPPTPVVQAQPTQDVGEGETAALTEKDHIKELKDKFDSVRNTDWYESTFAEGRSLDDIENSLHDDIATFTKHSAPITLNTVTQYDIKGGEIGTGYNLKDEFDTHLEDATSKNVEEDVPTYTLVNNDSNKATYRAQFADGTTLELTYDAANNTTKVTPISINEETNDPMEVLKKIDTTELKNYKEFITKQFGESAKDPLVKPLLDLYEPLFRHAMLTANMSSMGATFSIEEYDPEMENFDLDVTINKAGKYQVKNKLALVPFKDAIDQAIKYTKTYTPNIC